jgi:hypothetical protein
MAVICPDEQVARSLLAVRSFSAKTPVGSGTFFISGNQSWGSAMIIDVHNVDPAVDDWIGIFCEQFQPAIMWKGDAEKHAKMKTTNKWEPSDMQWTYVPKREVEKDVRGQVVRISFKPDDKSYKDFKIPYALLYEQKAGDAILKVSLTAIINA